MSHSPTTDRFIRYVRTPSQGDPKAPEDMRPTTPGQILMAEMVLADIQELAEFYGKEITFSLENGILIVNIPPMPGQEDAPHACISAHFDTYPNGSAEVTPIVHAAYQGGPIKLPSGAEIPEEDLEGLLGQEVVTSSGDSVLGADDKAGLATIVEALSKIWGDSVPHGKLTLLFFPDEEDGRFDPNDLPRELVESWDIFLTVDGGKLGEVDVGCYSGRTVNVIFNGIDGHPGDQGKKIVPAPMIAGDFMTQVGQEFNTPWNKGDDGSYQYPIEIVEGTTTRAVVKCIPRAFTDAKSLELVEELQDLARTVSAAWVGSSVEFEVIHQYTSTKDAMIAQPWSVDVIRLALQQMGIEMVEDEAMGGTDGAMLNLTFPNIPAPNIGVGGRNFHMLIECIGVQDLERGTDLVAGVIYQISLVRQELVFEDGI